MSLRGRKCRIPISLALFSLSLSLSLSSIEDWILYPCPSSKSYKLQTRTQRVMRVNDILEHVLIHRDFFDIILHSREDYLFVSQS